MSRGERLAIPDAEVWFFPAFFDAAESAAYLRVLSQEIAWEQHEVTLSGGVVTLPRLTAWYGDAGKVYHYSGVTVTPQAWTPPLLAIKSRVEVVAEIAFNTVLLNLYRSEADSVGWHSDDEPELGENPVIASVSFGATRPFEFKHKDASQRVSLDLTPGSLLIMRGATQHFWKHRIPKTKTPHEARINLTFRVIY